MQGVKVQYQELTAKFDEIIVELSYNCNLSCTMCGFGNKTNPYSKKKFLSFENFKNIIHQIGGIAKTIRLNGRGESTIHPNFVEILNFTKKHYPKLNINLFSNFSFKNDKVLDSLKDNGVQLFISMDSSDPIELAEIRKGANFQHIENNIRYLSGIANRPFIIFTIQEANIHRIFDIARYAYNNKCQILYNTIRRDEGIESFVEVVKDKMDFISSQFDMVREMYLGSSLQCLYPDQLAGINLNAKKTTQTHGTMLSCPALRKELCIYYDGSISPCNMFNPYRYGNIFRQSLDEILNSPERVEFMASHKFHYYCKNCANLGV